MVRKDVPKRFFFVIFLDLGPKAPQGLINQSSNQSITHSIHQFINPSINQSIKKLFGVSRWGHSNIALFLTRFDLFRSCTHVRYMNTPHVGFAANVLEAAHSHQQCKTNQTQFYSLLRINDPNFQN